MKKAFIVLIILLTSNLSFAGNSEYLVKILKDPKVMHYLEGLNEYSVKFEATNSSTSWLYTALFSYRKKAVSRETGEEIMVPCGLRTKIQTIGGVAGTDESEVVARERCLEPR